MQELQESCSLIGDIIHGQSNYVARICGQIFHTAIFSGPGLSFIDNIKSSIFSNVSVNFYLITR